MPYKDPIAALENARAYRNNNREHYRTLCRKRMAKWRANNLDYARKTRREARAKWRAANRERHRAEVKAWQKANPQKVCHQTKLKRARYKGAAGTHTLGQWMARVEFYGWKCRYCKTKLSAKTLTKDHRIPLSKGGSNWASNVVPACRSCNSHKHNKKK